MVIVDVTTSHKCSLKTTMTIITARPHKTMAEVEIAATAGIGIEVIVGIEAPVVIGIGVIVEVDIEWLIGNLQKNVVVAPGEVIVMTIRVQLSVIETQKAPKDINLMTTIDIVIVIVPAQMIKIPIPRVRPIVQAAVVNTISIIVTIIAIVTIKIALMIRSQSLLTAVKVTSVTVQPPTTEH